jgi:hypothetical protein
MKDLERLEFEIKNNNYTHFEKAKSLALIEIAKNINNLMYEINELRKEISNKK